MRKLLIFLAVVLIAYLGVAWYLSGLVLFSPDRSIATEYQMNRDRWGLNLDSVRQTMPHQRDFEFTAPDGITLRGWWYSPRPDSAACAVLFIHGYSTNRVNMIKYAPAFADCGCELVFFDHRGHGESDEAYGGGGLTEAGDLLALHERVRQATGLPDDRIGWFGESWGAATALQAAGAGRVNPAWVVAESPFSDWYSAVMERGVKEYGTPLKVLAPAAFRMAAYRGDVDFYAASPVQAAAKIQVPVLLLHSLADTLTEPAQSDLIAAAIRPDLLTYRPLDWGAWHAHNVVWRPKEYAEMVRAFTAGFCASTDVGRVELRARPPSR